MQEQNSEKVVALSVKATKMTANVLKSAIRQFLQAQKQKQPKIYRGKQSVKHLVGATVMALSQISRLRTRISSHLIRPPESSVLTTLSKRIQQKVHLSTLSFSKQRIMRL